MTKLETLAEIIENMPEWDLVDLHNSIADDMRDYDARIFYMDSFDDMMSGCTPTEIIDAIDDSDFSTSDDYFKDDCYYGLISFSDALDYIDVDEIAQTIIDTNSDYGYGDIRDFLDEYIDFDEDDEINVA